MDNQKPLLITSRLIEQLIDMLGTDQLLHGIAQVCFEKAEHIRTNWQDQELAQLWDKRADKITSLANKLT